ncbi:MAG: undecaprenyl/decaprenyl-phosphate alpha-N-acetylglucosaminyl 1-phosphate transferase [Acetobacteraceae bacterium]|nr:undecaprenyl/decaprenyl-phosphate alpha-N-acetylglucosaminyl 1-phosphate transferase [Acetobacteraceae bacterium]
MTWAAILRHLVFAGGLACVSARVVRAMVSAGVMDRPAARKAHVVATPKGGGVGIVVAFLLGVSVLYGFADFARLADAYFRGVVLAALAIAVVAYLDDIRDFPFVVKLAAQVAAALLAVGTGLYVEVFNLPGLGAVDIGVWGAVATVAWILFATNAMNFIDGLNGLVGGTVLVACGFLAVIAAGQDGWFVYFAALLLGAAVAGFLPFNFPSARIFMGDVGSQFCGFVLAMLGVAAARFQAVEMSFLLVPMLLSGVLFDVAFTLARRLLAGENIARAHRSHLYQVAHRAGVDARAIAVVHWGFAAIGGAVALAFTHAGPGLKLPLLAMLLVPQAVWLGFVVRRARASALGRW